jgi:purine-binding chemotaxis protein CheW
MTEPKAAQRAGNMKNSSVTEICSVQLNSALYGVPIRHILEIIGSARPQPVPLAPPFVGGLLHYRGDVLTTVSLRFLLGLPALDAPQAVLVLESPGGAFGLLVDSVSEVLIVSQSDIEPNPSTLADNRRNLLAGAYKLRNQLLVLLDPEWLDPIHLGPAQAA